MKKSIPQKLTSLFFVACTLTAILSSIVISVSAYSTGDLNNDKKINAIDAIALQQEILGKSDTALPSKLGDINHDGKINSADDNLLKLVILGSYTISEETYKIGTVTLGGADITSYSIVLPTSYPTYSTPESVQYAAEILQEYVNKACGISLPIVSESSGNTIAFSYDESLGSDAFTIEVKDGQVKLITGLSRAPIYAATGFLEEIFGYKFYPRDVIVVDEQDTISVEAGYTRTEGMNTPFSYRDAYSYSRLRGSTYPDSHSGYFILSTLANHNTGMWDGNDWINTAKYGYGYGPNRNHSTFLYIPNWDKGTGKACYTNPDNLAECITNVRAAIQGLLNSGRSFDAGTMPMISISIDDVYTWCSCRTCKNLIRIYGAQSATLMDFITKASETLTAEFPKVEFWTLAYAGAVTAPVNMDIADNLYICFAPIGHCSKHVFGSHDCALNRGGVNDTTLLEGWIKLTDKLHYWWYQCNYYYEAVPVGNFMTIYYNLKYMAEVGVKGVFTENEETFLGFSDLYTYLVSEYTWDPDMTEQEYRDVIKDFCRDVYGAEELYDILMILEEAGDRMPCWIYSDKPYNMFDFDYLSENYEKIFSTLEKARQNITDKDQLARLDRSIISIQFITLSAAHDRYYKNGNTSEIETFTQRYKVMYDWFINNKGCYYSKLSHFPDDRYAEIPNEFDPSIRPIAWYDNIDE